jgi:hypothetical protein
MTMEDIVIELFDLIDPAIKDLDLFHYVDGNIDSWGIDIGDYFLDDIIEGVILLRAKRAGLNRKPDGDDIIFQESEEDREAAELSKVSRQYDRLYSKALQIRTDNNAELSCSPEMTVSGSWSETLRRIDTLQERIKNIPR